jgi:hypothetical protein
VDRLHLARRDEQLAATYRAHATDDGHGFGGGVGPVNPVSDDRKAFALERRSGADG